MVQRKLLALLAAIALALPAHLSAQTPARHTTYGIVGAVNLSTFGGSDATGADNKVGFSVGGFARMPISAAWSFQPELEYAMKGAKQTDNSSGIFVTGSVDLSYIEMPLLFRVEAPDSPSGHLFAEVGPALAAKIDCSASGSGGGVTVSTSCTDLGADVKSFDVGAMVGAGYEFPIGTHALSIGVRYNYGLIEIATGANTKNRNLQFVGALRF